MGNLKGIDNLIPLLTVFISGIFGLMVAMLTWWLANQRERKKTKHDLVLRDYHDKVSLYVELLSTIEKTIRVVKSGSDSKLIDELSIASAKANLLATENINKKIEKLSDHLYEWSSEFRRPTCKSW